MPDLITSTNFNAFTVHKWTYGRHLCWLILSKKPHQQKGGLRQIQ